MKKIVLKPISILTVFCMVGASYAMPSPDTEVSLEFALTIVVSPNIINIESSRIGEIRINTGFRYASYIANGEAVFIYFNQSDSIENIRTTRDSLGNLILKFHLEDLLDLEENLYPDSENTVTVVLVMNNGDEFIGQDTVFLKDKRDQ